jgi:Ulp1 family protease
MDPTFLRTSTTNDPINSKNLQRLEPNGQLNSNIINTYHELCYRQQTDRSKKAVVTSFFWPQLVRGSIGHDIATKLLFTSLVSTVALSPCSRLT